MAVFQLHLGQVRQHPQREVALAVGQQDVRHVQIERAAVGMRCAFLQVQRVDRVGARGAQAACVHRVRRPCRHRDAQGTLVYPGVDALVGRRASCPLGAIDRHPVQRAGCNRGTFAARVFSRQHHRRGRRRRCCGGHGRGALLERRGRRRRALRPGPVPPGLALGILRSEVVQPRTARGGLVPGLDRMQPVVRLLQGWRRADAIAQVIVQGFQHQQRGVGTDQAEPQRQRLQGRAMRGGVCRQVPALRVGPGMCDQRTARVARIGQRHCHGSTRAIGGRHVQAQQRIRTLHPRQHPHPALPRARVIHVQVGQPFTLDHDISGIFAQQLRRGGRSLAGTGQHQQPPMPCPRPVAQAVRVGTCTGTAQRVQALPAAQHGPRALAIVGQPIADQQVFVDVGLCGPVAERAGAVLWQRGKVLAQRAPVAVADREAPRRLGAVAQYGQLHLAIADRAEVACQHRQLGGGIARARGSRGVPEQAHPSWQRAFAGLHRHRDLHHQVLLATEVAAQRVHSAWQRQGPAQLCRQRFARPRPHCPPSPFTQCQRHRSPARRSRHAGAHRVQPQLHRLCVAGELQRQRPAQAVCARRQCLAHGQRYAAGTARRNRIDAQSELVADGLFEQPRVDLASLDRFEYLTPLRLGNRDRISQAPVDVQRERGHLLALGQRKLQRAFQLAPVRVAEHQFDPRLAQAGGHMAVDPRLLQHHRLFGTGNLEYRLGRALRGRQLDAHAPANP